MAQDDLLTSNQPEPWLRGTLLDIPAVPRAVLHALQLAREDLHGWCGKLSDEELNSRPDGLPSVAFQLRHILGSINRLLTYAEGHVLRAEQLAHLKAETAAVATKRQLLEELDSTFEAAAARVQSQAHEDLGRPRKVGKKMLPTTLGGLLVHVADHTQRHVGQAITTTKLILARRKVR